MEILVLSGIITIHSLHCLLLNCLQQSSIIDRSKTDPKEIEGPVILILFLFGRAMDQTLDTRPVNLWLWPWKWVMLTVILLIEKLHSSSISFIFPVIYFCGFLNPPNSVELFWILFWTTIIFKLNQKGNWTASDHDSFIFEMNRASEPRSTSRNLPPNQNTNPINVPKREIELF